MRKIFAAICAIGCSLSLFGQDWHPVPVADRLHFRHSDSSLITQILQVDSSQALPGGSVVHFLNRIAVPCAGCTEPSMLRNRGQFLQEQMTLRSNGDCFFEGERRLLLRLQAQAGETWLFDTLQNLSATVAEVVLVDVLGEPDSIKRITLSDASEIVFSKNHGLVQWPDFQGGGQFDLAGIDTRQLGQWAPGWKEFYDFAPGDVFQYEAVATLDPGTPNNSYTTLKLTVLERWQEGDTLYCRMDRRSKTQLWGPFIMYLHDTVVQKFHPELISPWSEGWPGQAWQTQYHATGFGDSVWAAVSLVELPVYGVSKTLGNKSGQIIPNWPLCDVFVPATPTSDTILCDGCLQFSEVLSIGLGRTAHSYGCFEYFETETLTAFVKNGDTTGILLPDSGFTSAVQEPDFAYLIRVAPNPGSDVWRLHFSRSFSGPLQVVLFDVSGKNTGTYQMAAGETILHIDCARLPAGVYWLRLFADGGRATVRLLKK